MIRVLLGLILLFSFATVGAQTEVSTPEVSLSPNSSPEAQRVLQFLAAVQNHPVVRAQAALVAAARAQLEAVYSPVSFNASGNYTRLNLDIPEAPPGQEPGQETPDLPNNLVGLNLGANFRPFVFGDTADLARSRQIDLAKVELGYTETLSALQAQALGAAAQVTVAEESLNLATESRTLTESALAATRIRQTKGAAAESEVRALELQLREADNRLSSAGANLAIARRSLVNLVGETEAPGLVRLEPVTGTPPDVRRAALDLELARVGAGGAGRALYPTAQASYTWPLGDEKSELALSLESRTLQPGVSYSYANPRQGAAGFSAPEGVPASVLKGSFTVGVALNISPETYGAVQAADARVVAAAAGLSAALDNADITALSLQANYETAQLGLELAQQGVTDAVTTLQDVRARLRLGLATEFEVSQARFALTQTRLNERSAELNLLQATLDSYRTYAVPILPPAPEARP
ncbi:hypothetical protein BH24DEI2_BH24DEI2_25140 [soil metagenome]